MRRVYNSVQDRISNDLISDDIIPLADGQLTGNDSGLSSMPVLYDLHEVKQLLPVEHLHAKVIQYEQVRLCQLGKEAVQRA